MSMPLLPPASAPLVRRFRAALLVVGTLTPLLAACGGGGTADAATGVAVTASETTCSLARTDLPAGPVEFEVTNKGAVVTEVYVYGESGGAFSKVIGEVENIGPGTSRELKANLPAGTYEVACKPGQTGAGIRTRITVAGNGSAAAGSSPVAGGAARELELVTDGKTLSGLGGEAKKGETVEFELTNKAADERTLEIKKPSGEVAAEFDVKPGAKGETKVTLGDAGAWKVIVEGKGMPDIEQTLTVR